MNILTRIVAHKKEEVARTRKKIPLGRTRAQAETRGPGRGFFQRLKTPGPSGVNIIAEIKRASPSKGIIRADLDAGQYAAAYERGGAAALSVLTDGHFFRGAAQDLREARDRANLPVLRKDFIVSRYQIYESAAMGADAILLIVRILSKEQLKEYLDLAASLHLDVLVEVHTPEDLSAAAGAGAALIGINNRDLTTFATDIATAMDMAAGLQPHQVPVAASGIHAPGDIRANLKAGIFNFLIGESLVRSKDPASLLQSFMAMGTGA